MILTPPSLCCVTTKLMPLLCVASDDWQLFTEAFCCVINYDIVLAWKALKRYCNLHNEVLLMHVVLCHNIHELNMVVPYSMLTAMLITIGCCTSPLPHFFALVILPVTDVLIWLICQSFSGCYISMRHWADQKGTDIASLYLNIIRDKPCIHLFVCICW